MMACQRPLRLVSPASARARGDVQHSLAVQARYMGAAYGGICRPAWRACAGMLIIIGVVELMYRQPGVRGIVIIGHHPCRPSASG